MTSRYQDNFRHTALRSSSPSNHNSPSHSHPDTTNQTNNGMDHKPHHWYETIKIKDLVKIQPEPPVNPWAADPFHSKRSTSSHSSGSSGSDKKRTDSTASAISGKGAVQQDWHRGCIW